jgi:hypothetical protein
MLKLLADPQVAHAISSTSAKIRFNENEPS